MEYREKSTGTTDVAARQQNKLALKRILFAGIQTVGGSALAVYTYKNLASRIWPSVYTVIAFEGTYNVFKNIRKIFWGSVCNKRNESYSLHNVATGTIIYFGSLYAFSDSWTSNDKLWIPCLGFAASGFFYAVSSTYSGKTVSTVKPLSACCQMAFEPALIVGGATYLLYFRKHKEGWLFWFPLVATALTGFKFAGRGHFRVEDEEDPNVLPLKAIEKLMGGCLVTVSSIVSAIYTSTKEFHWSLKYFAIAMSFYGDFIFKSSIICFQYYLGMDEENIVYLHSFIIGTEAIILAFLMVKCTGYHRMACYMFPFLAVGGHLYQLVAIFHLQEILPPSLFLKYCQRGLGLLLIVCGSSASAYIGYRFGWRYSLLTIPFIPAGIDYTYQGFSETDES